MLVVPSGAIGDPAKLRQIIADADAGIVREREGMLDAKSLKALAQRRQLARQARQRERERRQEFRNIQEHFRRLGGSGNSSGD